MKVIEKSAGGRSGSSLPRYEKLFVAASFFASTCTFYGPCPAFLGFNGPSMIRSFPLLQESSELRFRFFLHNFGTKCLSKVNPRHWIYISFPVINSRFKRALVFFWPPDIVNFRLKSLFVITLVQSRRNVHTFDCFGRNGTDTFHHSTSKCHLTSCRSRHSSFLARNANENPSSETSRPLATKSLARPLCGLTHSTLNTFYPEIHEVDLWQVYVPVRDRNSEQNVPLLH